METVKIKKLNDMAIIPKKAHDDDAGFDLYASIPDPVVIHPHKTVLIGTGISVELPKNTFGAIFARSGLAFKSGLAPANKVGVVDCNYRGEVCVALHNHSDMPKEVSSGERIAQMVVMPYVNVSLELSEELSDTDRGEGGFGSTGKN